MFPLGTVLLPGGRLPMQVFEPRYVELVHRCTSSGSLAFGVVLIARGSEVGGDDVRTDIGTTARIDSCIPLPGNRFALDCHGADRFRVVRWLPDDPYPQAEIEAWPDVADGDDSDAVANVLAKRAELVHLVREVASRSGQRPPRFAEPQLPTDPSGRSFELAANLPISDVDRQRALAAPGPVARLGVISDALDDVIATLQVRLM